MLEPDDVKAIVAIFEKARERQRFPTENQDISHQDAISVKRTKLAAVAQDDAFEGMQEIVCLFSICKRNVQKVICFFNSSILAKTQFDKSGYYIPAS